MTANNVAAQLEQLERDIGLIQTKPTDIYEGRLQDMYADRRRLKAELAESEGGVVDRPSGSSTVGASAPLHPDRNQDPAVRS